MANFEKLGIPVYTPRNIWDVNLSKLSERMQGPVGVIADVEGTLVEWGNQVVSPEAIEWADDGFRSGSLAVIGLATNKGMGAGHLCEMVGVQLGSAQDASRILSEHPLTRDRRKPSGYLGSSLMTQTLDRELNVPTGFVIVGDKPSDLFEADAANQISRRGLAPRKARISLGFMVERFGEADHPLDRVRFLRMPSVRDRATAFREQARAAQPIQPYTIST